MADPHYPFLDSRVLQRLAALPLHARQPMLGSVTGKHKSPIRGSSLEFAEYRKYVPGDDTRRIDWRAWGRSDRYYIKEFEADTNLRLCLVVDTSGSLSFPVDGVTKLETMKSLAGTLAYLASRQGEAVGLYCAGSGKAGTGGEGHGFHTQIRPKRNGPHLSVVLDQLAALEAVGGTGLPQALHEAAEGIVQRALVVVISDLFVEPAVLGDCLQHLRYKKHDVVLFHLLDDREISFEFDRPTRFLDLEGGEPVMADPVVMAGTYRTAMQRYLAELKDVVGKAAVDYRRVNNKDSIDEVLSEFLLGRKQVGRGRQR